MSCSTRPAVRSYLNFIEEYTGEKITQDEWHKIRDLANADGSSKAKAGDNWRVVGVAVFDGTPVDFPIAKVYPSALTAQIEAEEGGNMLWLVDDLTDLTRAGRQRDGKSYLEPVQVRKMNDGEYAAALLDSSILREHLDGDGLAKFYEIEWEYVDGDFEGSGYEPNGDELSKRYADLANNVKENPPTHGTVQAIEYLATNGIKETLKSVREPDDDRAPWNRRRPLKIRNPHYDLTSTVTGDREDGGFDIEVENPRWKHSLTVSPVNSQGERNIRILGFDGAVVVRDKEELVVQESAAFIAEAAEERLRWRGRTDLDDLYWTIPDGWGMD